jgi:hypothetical protein
MAGRPRFMLKNSSQHSFLQRQLAASLGSRGSFHVRIRTIDEKVVFVDR